MHQQPQPVGRRGGDEQGGQVLQAYGKAGQAFRRDDECHDGQEGDYGEMAQDPTRDQAYGCDETGPASRRHGRQPRLAVARLKRVPKAKQKGGPKWRG